MINKEISIIVPCYNEEEVIVNTNEKLFSVLSDSIENFDIIYINDGSSDETLSILKSFPQKSQIKIVNLTRNFGHQAAVSAGLSISNKEFALIIDADLQDPPECIPQMLQLAIDEDAQVVYGVRRIRKGETIFKKITAKIFYRVLNYFSEYKIPVDTGDFRLISKEIIDDFNRLKEKHKYIRGLISWLGYKQIPFYYDRNDRVAGETHYPFWKMVDFALKGLLYFSKKPLTIATNLGIGSVAVSILFLIVSLIRYFDNPENFVTGWTSIICLIVFFGGVQLLTIGLLGSYIGNIFDEVKERPEFLIKEII